MGLPCAVVGLLLVLPPQPINANAITIQIGQIVHFANSLIMSLTSPDSVTYKQQCTIIETLETIHLLETLQRIDCKGSMVSMAKRTISITAKMTAEDYAHLTKAAQAIWPGALLTKSSIVLGLAKLGADTVLKGKKGK